MGAHPRDCRAKGLRLRPNRITVLEDRTASTARAQPPASTYWLDLLFSMPRHLHSAGVMCHHGMSRQEKSQSSGHLHQREDSMVYLHQLRLGLAEGPNQAFRVPKPKLRCVSSHSALIPASLPLRLPEPSTRRLAPRVR